MSLFNVEFSSDDDSDDVPIMPFNPKYAKKNIDQNAKPKYLQEPTPQRRTRREPPVRVEKTVVDLNAQPIKTEVPSNQATPTRRTRRGRQAPVNQEPVREVVTPKKEEEKSYSYDEEESSESPQEEIAVVRRRKPEKAPAEKPKQTRKKVVIPEDSEYYDNEEEAEKEKDKAVNNSVKEAPKEEKKPEEKKEKEHPDVHKKGVAIPVEIKPKEMPMSDISRKKTTSITGTIFEFKYYYNTNLTMSAKYKKGNEFVAIAQGEEVHLKGPSYASLAIGNHGADFSLRMGSVTGEEIITVRFLQKEKDELARKMIVSFFASKEGQPLRLFSRQPVLEDGELNYDFKGRFKLQSIKNAVLYEKKNKEDLLWIRKIRPDVLELQAAFEVDQVVLFAIGLASFITSVK